jgi:hypothetical protein
LENNHQRRFGLAFINLEYVPPERREPLQRFCASLQKS